MAAPLYRFSGYLLVDGEVHRRRSRSLGATTVEPAGNGGIGDGHRHGSRGRDRCRLNRGRELGRAHPRSDLGRAIEIYACTGGKVGAIDFEGDSRAAGDCVVRNESVNSGHCAWLNRCGGLGVSAADRFVALLRANQNALTSHEWFMSAFYLGGGLTRHHEISVEFAFRGRRTEELLAAWKKCH
jgi:hypothetical protein